MQLTNFFDTEQFVLKKYIYWWLIALRLLIGLHVFYLYASSLGWWSGKGGTFLEATTSPITFLPYASEKDDDKLFQNMLYQGCTQPVFSGSNILYENELCDIRTQDYQTFSVTVPANNTRSDGEPITIEDVYFTYVTLLTENIWNLWYVERYQNITSVVDGSEIRFTFPSASIDNMIFFTNFILPQHSLVNQEYTRYTSNFANELVSSTCVVLDTWWSDELSAIFDLSNCDDFNLKFFQVKYFDEMAWIIEYSQENPSIIDLTYSPVDIEWFNTQEWISNKFSTLFFNTTSGNLNQNQRNHLSKLFIDINKSNASIVPDQFLFNALPAWKESDLEVNPFLEDAIEENEEEETPSLALPEVIPLNEETPTHEYEILNPISSSIPINMKFDKPYTTIFVNYNNGLNYTPESYNSSTQTANYNLNPRFNNIVEWLNSYAIQWVNEDGTTDNFTISISYLQPLDVPEQDIIEEEVEEQVSPRYRFIYFSDELNTSTIKIIKQWLEDVWYGDLFEFIGYSDTNELDGKISAGEFDVVIRTLDMWLRRDLSNLFITDDRYINPSGYVNEEISSLIQEYFISWQEAKDRSKSRLDILYSANVPFVILGKKLESYLINDKYDESPFPERLYVLGRRKKYLKEISLITNTSIERSEVFKRNNFVTFIKEL